MGLISLLDLEGKVQTGDLTRFNAEKSLKTKDVSAAIASVLIAPGTATPIEVFDADPRKWFLDWVWDDWKWDIDSTFNKIYFYESGVEKIATLTSGEYDLSGLLNEIATQMNAVGGQVYTVAKTIRNEMTISATGIFGYKVRNKDAAVLSILGFPLDSDKDKASFTGLIVETSRRKIELTLSTVGATVTATKTFYMELLTPESDYLFSADKDLVAEEADIMKVVPRGRATHISVHRRAQDHIIDWLDRNGYRDDYGKTLTKWNVTNRNQVRLWSAYMALKFIYNGIHNSSDDVFEEKASYYEKYEIAARNRAILELALTKESKESGKVTGAISPSVSTGTLFRR